MASPQRKPQPDIYTLLLAIALVAMIVCAIMLYLETAEYGPNKTSGVPPMVQMNPSNIDPFDHGMLCLTSKDMSNDLAVVDMALGCSPGKIT